MQDHEARESKGKKLALDQLKKIIAVGEKHQTEVIQRALKRTIIDKLVDPRNTTIDIARNQFHAIYKDITPHISNHALGQICTTVGVPKQYLNKLMSEEFVGMPVGTRHGIALNLLNTHLHEGVFLDRKKQRMKFLHRILNGELWGFLSRSFNRKMGTTAMMRPFLEECAFHRAKPTEAHASALRTSIKCMLPVIYEPVEGEFVAFGATYTNSDFGAGSLEVRGTILRVSSGSINVLPTGLKRIHIGSVIQDGELELSDSTLEAESQAQMGAVRDKVRSIFMSANIEDTLKLISLAHEYKMSWNDLKTRANEVLNKEELGVLENMLKQTSDGEVDLPPISVNKNGDPEANRWWAAAALGVIAAGVQDVDRKIEVQEMSGGLLK